MSFFDHKWAPAGAATVLGVGLIALGGFAANASGLLPSLPSSPAVTLSPTDEATPAANDDDPATHDVGDDNGNDDGVSDDDPATHDVGDDHGDDGDEVGDDDGHHSGSDSGSDDDSDDSGSDDDSGHDSTDDGDGDDSSGPSDNSGDGSDD